MYEVRGWANFRATGIEAPFDEAVAWRSYSVGWMQIAEYDPRWAFEFEAERERIAAALGRRARRIDHHGSTSVPGLAAKPIIDIQVSVDALQPIVAYAAPLAAIGYVHMPHPDDAFCPFFHKPAVWPHTHHVHVVRHGSEEERRTLAFRDYLREHPEAAREYEALKRDLASRFDASSASQREAYADAKCAFVERATAAALASGYPKGVPV